MNSVRTIAALVGLSLLLPTEAFAYIGPGAGLGLLGTLLAVVGALLVALFGVIVFPITILRKRRRNRAAAAAASDGARKD